MRISCFGVDGHGNSPVQKIEEFNKDNKKEKYNSQEVLEIEDPIFNPSNTSKNNPYEDYIPSRDLHDDNESSNVINCYKINIEQDFYPINMLSPIQWIVKGIEQYYPQVDQLSTEENNEDFHFGSHIYGAESDDRYKEIS